MQISLLFNPAFKISLGFVIIAQTIVASSTFFIAKLAQSVADGHLSLAYLIGFVASLTLVLIPLYFANIYLERAKFDALYQYNQAFEQHFLGKTHHYNNSQLKATAMAMLAQESKMTLDSSLDDIFDIITLIANVAFNLIVIAWVLDVWILAGYAVGILLAMGCVKLLARHLNILLPPLKTLVWDCCHGWLSLGTMSLFLTNTIIYATKTNSITALVLPKLIVCVPSPCVTLVPIAA